MITTGALDGKDALKRTGREQGAQALPFKMLSAILATSNDLESSQPCASNSGYGGAVEDEKNYKSVPCCVEYYKSTDNLNKDTCNRLLLAFALYYDHGKGFPKKKPSNASQSSENILNQIESILYHLDITAKELAPKYQAVLLSEAIIAHLVKGQCEAGLRISEQALELATKENLVGLTLRIHSYRNALFRDQGLFGLTERERMQGAQIYSAVSSYTDRSYFHFNAGKEKARYLAVCHGKAYNMCSREATAEFKNALYLAGLERNANGGSLADNLEKVTHCCLVQLAMLQDDAKEGCRYLADAFKTEMPILYKLYYTLACSDIFQKGKLVEESYIFARWCQVKCSEHGYNTELKMAEQRVQKYKTILKEDLQDKLDMNVNVLFNKKFRDVLQLLQSISNADKQQGIEHTPRAYEAFRFAETEDSDSLDNALCSDRFQTTESETELKVNCGVCQRCTESGEETVPTSGTDAG